jgi:chromosome segregation ATPase
MDSETRAAFARIDRYFELGKLQHQELRNDVQGLKQDMHELKQDMHELKVDVHELKQDLSALAAEFRSFRDWATVQFAELRTAIRDLTRRLERVEG